MDLGFSPDLQPTLGGKVDFEEDECFFKTDFFSFWKNSFSYSSHSTSRLNLGVKYEGKALPGQKRNGQMHASIESKIAESPLIRDVQ